MTDPSPDKRQVLADLRVKLTNIEQHQAAGATTDATSSGCNALDAILPRGGFQRGQLIEWLSPYAGSGAMSWALQSCKLLADGGPQSIVVIDLEQTFHPPAAFGMGVDLERLVVVRPKNAADAIWALDQSLRNPAVAAACATLPRLDPRDFRRLQLAAEQGNTTGHLLRPLSVRGQPSWADFQLLVQPRRSCTSKKPASESSRHRTWHLELVRCRGGRPGAVVHVAGDITTGRWQPVTTPPLLSRQPHQESPLSNSVPSRNQLHDSERRHEKSNAVQRSKAITTPDTVRLAAELARSANSRRATRA